MNRINHHHMTKTGTVARWSGPIGVLSILVVILTALPRSGHAHGLAPALLDIAEGTDGRFEVSFTAPAASASQLELQWPQTCTAGTSGRRSHNDGTVIARHDLDCGSAGLLGKRIAIAGLAVTRTEVLVRITWHDGHAVTAVLHSTNPTYMVPERTTAGALVLSYLFLGIEHILLGIDHLLFVLGLLMLIDWRKQLLLTITAFTVGHSVTLSIAILGTVAVPTAPVEAIIALSIVFLAVEIVRADPASPVRRAPWSVAAGFGLLHGFGFAGALTGIGLPDGEVAEALFLFNLGVESGQLLFVGVVAIIVMSAGKVVRTTRGMMLASAYAIGSLAAFWALDRILEIG